MFEKNALAELSNRVKQKIPALDGAHVLVGFDGYIDKLVRLPRGKDYFSSISEFVDYISGYRNQSADLRMERISEKLGGNGPLLAQSLAAKGVAVTCVGTMGKPEVRPQFLELAEQCRVISVDQPADCFAIEFADGKLMFGDTAPLERLTFQRLCEKAGKGRLIGLLDQCDLFCFANWSAISHANELLSDILTELGPGLYEKPRTLFFDLADPSAVEEAVFYRFFELLPELKKVFSVTVGLNPKEFLQVYNRFFHCDETKLTPEMPPRLMAEFPADEIVLHGLDYAVAGDKSYPMRRVPGAFVPSPKVVTGGGDNFNAGYCLGKLLGLLPGECAMLGNISSMLYVRDGAPAGLQGILNLLSSDCG